MSNNVDLAQLKCMSGHQSELYTVHEESDVGFPFANDQRLSLAYFPYIINTPAAQEGENFVFNMDPYGRYHLLISSSLNFKLPQLKIRESYRNDFRIAWKNDLGYNVVSSGDLLIDGEIFQTLTASSMKHAEQFCYLSNADSENKRKIMSRSNGNDSSLTNWSVSLPEFEIISEQPWFYSRGTIISLPLKSLYPGLYEQISQRYSFDLEVANLLRAQCKDESGEWIEIPFSEAYHVIEGLPQNSRLPVPSLQCEYIRLGEEAVSYFRECSEPRFREFIVPVFNSYRSNDETELGRSARINITNDRPCTALMWSLRNIKNLGEISYCTTKNPRNPIKTCSLSFYDGSSENFLFRNLSSAQFSRGIHTRKFPSAPNVIGMNAWSIALDAGSLDIDSTFAFTPARNSVFSCQLCERSVEDVNDKFILELTTIELRKFSIDIADEESGDGKTKKFKFSLHY